MRLILGGCFVFMLNFVIIHVQAENELELNLGPLIKTFNKASTIGEPINLPYAKEDLEKAGNQESLEKYPVKINSADLKEDNNLDSNTEQSTDIPADESVKNQLSNTLMKDPEAIINSRQDTENGVPTQINDDIKEEIIKQYLLKEIHNPVIPTDDIKHDEKQKVLRHLLSNVLSNAEDVNQMPTKVEDMDKIKKTQESDIENPDEVNSNQFISKDMKNVESVTKQNNMLDESVKVSDILNNSEKDNNDLIKASMKKMNGEAKDNIRYLLDVNLKPELPELVKKFQTLGSDSGKLLNQEHSTQSDQTENNHPSEDNRKENDTKILAGNDTTPVENNKEDVPSTSDTIPTVESSTAVGDTTDTPNSETSQGMTLPPWRITRKMFLVPAIPYQLLSLQPRLEIPLIPLIVKQNRRPIRQVTPAETSGVENGDSTTESPKDIDNPSLQVGSGFDSNGNKEDDRKIVDQRSQTGPSSDLE
ncbi:origin recognition complex subunit 1-like [Diaphorina citri]|uniref:Origin recognition complex subunit 1-like n=1 Tax=Diaphorina citri TaxID=121845 RepID=A0A1S4ESQ3_DIACI|nr:origin recognition complex subunit 1-like [Diaphorina citri]